MGQYIEHDAEPLLGLAAGLAAGLIGAFAMSEFQTLLSRANISSGVSGTPSTEKAADRAVKIITGRKLRRSRRPVAGEAVHYAFGGLVGGLYGAAAEFEPRVTFAKGAAFGVAAATIVDETLTPATGLADPFWRAPVISHPYSYASHLVFGMTTDVARDVLRRFLVEVKAGIATLRQKTRMPRQALPTPAPETWRTLTLAFLLGATAGPRTTAPLTAVTWAARLGLIDLKGSPLSFLASPAAAAVVTPAAISELVLDKLPATPDRTQPGAVAARAVTGALSASALVGGRSASAALAGAIGAVAATYLGHAVRARLSNALGEDWPVAGAEDVLAFGGAAMVCFASLAPTSNPARL